MRVLGKKNINVSLPVKWVGKDRVFIFYQHQVWNVLMIWWKTCLHMGQVLFVNNLLHSKQTHKCPQGMITVFILASMHTLHSSSSSDPFVVWLDTLEDVFCFFFGGVSIVSESDPEPLEAFFLEFLLFVVVLVGGFFWTGFTVVVWVWVVVVVAFCGVDVVVVVAALCGIVVVFVENGMDVVLVVDVCGYWLCTVVAKGGYVDDEPIIDWNGGKVWVYSASPYAMKLAVADHMSVLFHVLTFNSNPVAVEFWASRLILASLVSSFEFWSSTSIADSNGTILGRAVNACLNWIW